MKNLFVILLVVVMGVTTGCVSTRPVVSKSIKDSVVVHHVVKDSLVYKETVSDKVIPESKADLVLYGIMENQADHKTTLDSLVRALKSLPKGVPITITHGSAQLQLLKDSLGKVVLRCAALERHYQERETKQAHYNSTLINKLTEKNKQETLLVDSRSFWQKLWQGLNWKAKSIIAFVIFGLGFITGMWVISRFEWGKKILQLLKLNQHHETT